MAKTQNTTTEIEIREFILEIVGALLDLIEEIDPFLRKHAERVADNCANFCQEYKIIAEEKIDTIYFAGLLHDVGLVGVPMDILRKSDPLSIEEQSLIKRHPDSGAKILANLNCLNDLLPMIRHHHEGMDGSGYPNGLIGTDIPFGARIISLVDYFDKIAFPRSAEKRMPIADALNEIKRKSKQSFDEGLIPDFISFIESNSGKSGSYILNKETAYIREAFTEILQKFKTGELTPPIVPHVVREIQSIFRKDSSTAEEDELASAIEKDPVISLRLISIANSPVYRGISKIRNVRTAIARLGLKETLSLVIAMVQKSLYETDKVQFKILMDKLWVHSLATAYGAKLMGQNLKLEDPDNLFLLGMTHDIGKIFLLKAFTDVLEDKSLHMDAIKANLQVGHIGITGMLLKRWGFDEEFIRILTQHESNEYSYDTEKEILILHLSNMLTRKIGFSLIEDEIEISELDSAKILKMEPETIDSIGEEVKQIIQSVAHLF